MRSGRYTARIMDAQNGFRSDAAQPALVDSAALSPKRERFAQEYLASLNASEAARRAGYSEHTAKQQGSFLLTVPDVQMRVQQLQEERAARTLISQDRVLLELWGTYQEARKLKHLAAANQSLQLIGRHLSHVLGPC